MNNGYAEVLAKGHAGSRSSGWIYEHRLVASVILGRPLEKEECVHHKDENRLNNSRDNLMVFRTISDHSRFHQTGVAVEVSDGTWASPKQEKRTNPCKNCEKECKKMYCSHSCASFGLRRAVRPSIDELKRLVAEHPMTHVAAMFGVTDNAVRKWLNKTPVLSQS